MGVEAASSLRGVLDDLPSSLQFTAAHLADAGTLPGESALWTRLDTVHATIELIAA